MDERGKKNRQSLFELAMIIYTIKDILEPTELFRRPEWLDTLFVLAFLGVIAWKLLLEKYTYLQLVLMVAGAAMCTYTCVKGNYFYVLISYMCILGVRHVDLQAVMRKVGWIKIVAVGVHVGYYGICRVIMPSKIHYIWRNGVKRSSFFLSHPNTFSMVVLWATAALAYGYYKTINRGQIALLWGINLFFYCYTNSNTSLMVSTIIYGLMLLDKSKVKIDFGLNAAKYVFGMFSVLIPLFATAYTRLSGPLLSIYEWLNDFFTGRLLFGSYVYDVYGISWLGRSLYFPPKIYWHGHWFDEMVFDNAYLWMFVIYGYVYILILSVAFFLVGRKASNLEKIMMIGYSFYGIMEAYILSASHCFPLMFIGLYLYQWLDRDAKKNKSKYLEPKLVWKTERSDKHGGED